METIKKNLNTIGLILIGLALISRWIWPYKEMAALIMAGLGIAAIVVYVFFHRSSLQRSFSRKSFLYSSNLVLVIVLVLAIIVLVNYFFARHHYRVDFTEAKIHSLSDQSIQVLKNLKQEIQIKCFFTEGNYGRSRMENLLKIYAYHSGKIKSEFIDPDKNPSLVRAFNITQDGTSILTCGDKENRITTTTEEDITNAIIKVTREKKKVVYFLEGHGEGSIEQSEDTGYSFIKEDLEKLAYEAKKLTLALSDTFPKDCAVLVVPGPRKDLLPNELETIQNYLDSGGRVFFMVDPDSAPDLKPFLEKFGIRLDDGVIVDAVSRLYGADYTMPVMSEYENHEITRAFRYATFFPYARGVEVADSKPEGITATVLGKTSGNSWSETNLEQEMKTGRVSLDKDKDKPGPIPLAVVATIKPKEQEKTETTEAPEKKEGEDKSAPEKIEEPEPSKEGRLAVFGDSDFVTNRYYNLSGNANLFLNALNWLAEEADLISIQPKTSEPRTLQLTPSQGRMIFFVSIIILPLAVLILGISVWVRRRSL
jgi:ABC-type uncharacterized transport system involved in gliding motility auxiliary subunit